MDCCIDNLMTCDSLTPYHVEYEYSCSVNIIVSDKLALEKPYDQDQQYFLHYDCE